MKRKYFKRILVVMLLLAMVFVGGAFLFYRLVEAGSFGPLPGSSDLQKIRNSTATVVYSSDNRQIGRIFAENRTNVKYHELPQNLIDALVATEDARFFEHEGVDRRSLVRVLVKSIILSDERAGGGSTIAQQLAKNLYGRKSFGFLTMPVNKTKEIILALRLEDLYTKEELIELYFNTVPFSENVYGIETAALRFFSKEPEELAPHESAVLVGMLKANTYYNPRLNPQNALERRNVVLHQMSRYGYIDPGMEDSLQALPLGLRYRNSDSYSFAAYFLSQVKLRAKELVEQSSYDTLQIETDGLKIYTTLQANMQMMAIDALEGHMASLQGLFNDHWSGQLPWDETPEFFDQRLRESPSYKRLKAKKLSRDSLDYRLSKKHPVEVFIPGYGDTVMALSVIDSVTHYLTLLRAGFLALDPDDGAILCWVGGYDHQRMPYDHVMSRRQAASTFKPIVYASALKQGVEPCDYISNERMLYEEFGDWAPKNYDGEYGGYYSMAGALKKSINVAAVQTIFETGVSNVLATARDVGIESRLPDDPSLALGTGSVSLLEMVRAYATFANGGFRVNPYFITRIEDSRGNVIYRSESEEREEALTPDISNLMNHLLQGVVDEGTGIRLRHTYGLKTELAGKTGTAQNYTDGWFIGYNPRIVAGAWVGGSYPQISFRTGNYGSGSAMALPIFGGFFRSLETDGSYSSYVSTTFEPLTPEQRHLLDCEDYREKNFFDNFKGLFNQDEGKPYADSNKEKQGFLKGLFKKKKK